MDRGDRVRHCEADQVTHKQLVRMHLLQLSAGTKGCRGGTFIFNSDGLWKSIRKHDLRLRWHSTGQNSHQVCVTLSMPGIHWYTPHIGAHTHGQTHTQLFQALPPRVVVVEEKSIWVGVCYKLQDLAHRGTDTTVLHHHHHRHPISRYLWR